MTSGVTAPPCRLINVDEFGRRSGLDELGRPSIGACRKLAGFGLPGEALPDRASFGFFASACPKLRFRDPRVHRSRRRVAPTPVRTIPPGTAGKPSEAATGRKFARHW